MSTIGDYLLSMSDETVEKLFKNTSMLSRAESINEDANRMVRFANQDYIRMRNKAMDAMNDLNMRKIKVVSNELARFVNAFSKIANIEVSDITGLTELKSIKFSLADYKGMRNEIMDMEEFIKSGMKTYAAGIALGGIGGWLVGSAIMGQKAKESLNNAQMNMASAEVKVEVLETEEMQLEAIAKLAKQQDRIIRKLVKMSKIGLNTFEEIVNSKTDWNVYSEEEKKECVALMSLMKLIKTIIDIPIVDTEGKIASDVAEIEKNEDLKALGLV